MSSARTSASKSRTRPASRSPSLLPVPSPVELLQTGENDPPILMFRELDADQVDALPSANSAELWIEAEAIEARSPTNSSFQSTLNVLRRSTASSPSTPPSETHQLHRTHSSPISTTLSLSRAAAAMSNSPRQRRHSVEHDSNALEKSESPAHHRRSASSPLALAAPMPHQYFRIPVDLESDEPTEPTSAVMLSPNLIPRSPSRTHSPQPHTEQQRRTEGDQNIPTSFDYAYLSTTNNSLPDLNMPSTPMTPHGDSASSPKSMSDSFLKSSEFSISALVDANLTNCLKLGDVQDLKDIPYRSNCQNIQPEDAFSVFELTNNACIVANVLPKLVKHSSTVCCVVQSWNKSTYASTDTFQSLVLSACQQRTSSNMFDELTSSESLNLLVFQLMGSPCIGHEDHEQHARASASTQLFAELCKSNPALVSTLLSHTIESAKRLLELSSQLFTPDFQSANQIRSISERTQLLLSLICLLLTHCHEHGQTELIRAVALMRSAKHSLIIELMLLISSASAFQQKFDVESGLDQSEAHADKLQAFSVVSGIPLSRTVHHAVELLPLKKILLIVNLCLSACVEPNEQSFTAATMSKPAGNYYGPDVKWSELQHELSSIGAAEVHRSSAELPQSRPIPLSPSAKLPHIQRAVDDKCTDRSSARHHDLWKSLYIELLNQSEGWSHLVNALVRILHASSPSTTVPLASSPFMLSKYSLLDQTVLLMETDEMNAAAGNKEAEADAPLSTLNLCAELNISAFNRSGTIAEQLQNIDHGAESIVGQAIIDVWAHETHRHRLIVLESVLSVMILLLKGFHRYHDLAYESIRALLNTHNAALLALKCFQPQLASPHPPGFQPANDLNVSELNSSNPTALVLPSDQMPSLADRITWWSASLTSVGSHALARCLLPTDVTAFDCFHVHACLTPSLLRHSFNGVLCGALLFYAHVQHDGAAEPSVNIRTTRATVHLLRLTHKLSKRQPLVAQILVRFKAHLILKPFRVVDLHVFRAYFLKLFKSLFRFTQKKWRQLNVELISDIWHGLDAGESRSPHLDFVDEWLAPYAMPGTGFDVKQRSRWFEQNQELALRCESFHRHLQTLKSISAHIDQPSNAESEEGNSLTDQVLSAASNRVRNAVADVSAFCKSYDANSDWFESEYAPIILHA